MLFTIANVNKKMCLMSNRKKKKMKYLCSEHYFVEEFSFRSEDNDNDGNVNDNDYFGSGAVVVGTR